ncbi:hypothetical protein DRJ25_02745 [Candidatus Woesearchaeota archaeon]|nr:MAG: hypothetical protein DRJ25_02745 [Candidatus Woesearchaeota archaeon]
MLENQGVVGFDNLKKTALSRIDKSKKGSIDKRIKQLLSIINKTKDYFTTSSCSGRIVLLKKGRRKDQCEWIYTSHDLADEKEMRQRLSEAKGNIFLKMESMILHVSCRTLKDADKLLKEARKIYKRAGIISLKKLSIEIMGSDFLETPVKLGDRLLVDEECFGILVKEANKKLKSNWKKTKEFEENLKNTLKLSR